MTDPNMGLYLLRDGTYGDPAEVTTGPDGIMTHKNGMQVVIDHGKPVTRGDYMATNYNKQAAEATSDHIEPVDMAFHDDVKHDEVKHDEVKPPEEPPPMVENRSPAPAPPAAPAVDNKAG